MGLVCYHAYSVVGLSQLSDGTQLVRIRNTWGHSEWLGNWSDTDDDHWTEFYDDKSASGPFGDSWHTKEGVSKGNEGGPWDAPSTCVIP